MVFGISSVTSAIIKERTSALTDAAAIVSIATKNEPFSQSGSEFPRGNSLTFLEPVVFSGKRLTSFLKKRDPN